MFRTRHGNPAFLGVAQCGSSIGTVTTPEAAAGAGAFDFFFFVLGFEAGVSPPADL